MGNGVGKTAIVEGLAQRIVKKDVPEGLKDRTIFALDMSALVAGAKFRGEFEERLQAVLNEIKRVKVAFYYSLMNFTQSSALENRRCDGCREYVKTDACAW